MPYWFLIALGCALMTACSDAVAKRIMRENDEWMTGTIVLVVSVVILTPVVLSMELKPVTVELVVVLAIALPLEILGYYLFLSAIRMAPLSLTVPLLAFTPVLTILTAAALLGESVSLIGSLGIVLVTVGAYVLNGDPENRSLLAPVAAIFSNPGARRMLLVAVIWSLTSALGKKGILIFGAIPFGFLLVCGILAVFAITSAVRIKTGYGRTSLQMPMPAWFLLGGLFMAGAEITHFVSLSMAPVAYMISVKRLSLVFGVLLGWIFFSERNIRYRMIGAVVMVVGVFMLYG